MQRLGRDRHPLLSFHSLSDFQIPAVSGQSEGGAMKVRTDIKFAWVRRTDDHSRFRIGVGADGSMWVPAADLGLSDLALAVMKQRYGAVVLRGVDDGCFYVDTRAVVLSCPMPELREILEKNQAKFRKFIIPKAFPEQSAGNNETIQ
jgi:hypothetical protein